MAPKSEHSLGAADHVAADGEHGDEPGHEHEGLEVVPLEPRDLGGASRRGSGSGSFHAMGMAIVTTRPGTVKPAIGSRASPGNCPEAVDIARVSAVAVRVRGSDGESGRYRRRVWRRRRRRRRPRAPRQLGSWWRLGPIRGEGAPGARPPSRGRAAVPAEPPAAEPAPKRRATAEQMATRQREISISEFFTKNRHLLGFDNPSKALLTTIKEAVDNSLDACEEAGILPEITIEVRDLGFEAGGGELTKGEGRFVVVGRGQRPGHRQGPGPEDLRQAALRLEVPPAEAVARPAGHRHQRRRPCTASSPPASPSASSRRTGKGKPAHVFDIQIDTRKNSPVVTRDETLDGLAPGARHPGRARDRRQLAGRASAS